MSRINSPRADGSFMRRVVKLCPPFILHVDVSMLLRYTKLAVFWGKYIVQGGSSYFMLIVREDHIIFNGLFQTSSALPLIIYDLLYQSINHYDMYCLVDKREI